MKRNTKTLKESILIISLGISLCLISIIYVSIYFENNVESEEELKFQLEHNIISKNTYLEMLDKSRINDSILDFGIILNLLGISWIIIGILYYNLFK